MPDPWDPRTYLAAERTLLAWIRTGLTMMGFGFVVARFGIFLRELDTSRNLPLTHGRVSPLAGTALVFLGTLLNAFAAVRYRRLLKLWSDPATLGPRAHGAAPLIAILLALLGLLLSVYLFLTR